MFCCSLKGGQLSCAWAHHQKQQQKKKAHTSTALTSDIIPRKQKKYEWKKLNKVQCTRKKRQECIAAAVPRREARGNDKSSSQLKPSSSSMFVIMNWKRDFGFFSKGTHLGYFLMHNTGSAEMRMLRCGSHKRVGQGQELFITSHDRVSQSTLTLLGLLHFLKKICSAESPCGNLSRHKKVHRN